MRLSDPLLTVRPAVETMRTGGVHIRHKTARSQLVLIPLLHKPLRLDSLKPCNTCAIVHPAKTLHLWVDDTGGAIVSTGVLQDLQKAGTPDIRIVSTVGRPPALRLGGKNASRVKIDAANRKQTFWQAPPAGLIKKGRLLRGGTK